MAVIISFWLHLKFYVNLSLVSISPCITEIWLVVWYEYILVKLEISSPMNFVN